MPNDHPAAVAHTTAADHHDKASEAHKAAAEAHAIGKLHPLMATASAVATKVLILIGTLRVQPLLDG